MNRRLLAVLICFTLILTACGTKTKEKTDVNQKPVQTSESVKKAEESQKPDVTQEYESKKEDSAATDSEQVKNEYVEESGNDGVDYGDEYYGDDYYTDEYYGDDYYDGGYDDGGYGYGVYGDYDNGYGGYLCDYGTYTAYIDTPDGTRTKSYIHIYNADGCMSAEVTVYDINDDYDSLWCYVYTDATEAFGDASRDTEVEMDMSLDDDNFSFSHDYIKGGRLEAVVYWPGAKCHYKLTCGNGTVYEFTGYPE